MVDYAHVVQRLGPPVGLDKDANGSPDFVPITEGMAIFMPTALVRGVADGVTVAVVGAPIVATLTDAGYLTFGGKVGVDLPDLGATSVTPAIPRDHAAYVVKYDGLRYQGQAFTIPSVAINPVAGATFDLSNAIPLDLPEGITIEQLSAIATDAAASKNAAAASAASINKGVAGGVAALNGAGKVTNADGSLPAGGVTLTESPAGGGLFLIGA